MTHAETMLQAIEAVLEGRITADIEQYTIAGRSITKIPIEQLIKLHSHYAILVKLEKRADDIAQGMGVSNNVRVRFKE